MAFPTELDNYPKLSSNSLKRILSGENIDNVILQVLGYKRVPASRYDRFRLLLNDGETLFPFAVLATQLNHLIEEKKLEKFTILKLDKYACAEVRPNKKVILCLELESLVPGSDVKCQISLSNSTELPSLVGGCLPISSNYNFESTFRENSSITYASNPNHISNKNINQTTKFFPTSKISPHVQNTSVHDNFMNNATFELNKTNFNRPILNSGAVGQKYTIVPILNLTPYLNRWIIRAQVIYKTCIVSYNNQRGNGKFFSFYLLDDTRELKATAFNEQAEFLHDFLKLNQIYNISGALVRPSKENAVMKCDFEITVTENTRIELSDDVNSTPMLQFNFIPISQIQSTVKDSYIDVIGICCSKSEVRIILNKTNNREVHKLDMILIDLDKIPITLSLWGSDAVKFKGDVKSVIVVRNAKVTDFFGCALSVSPMSMLFVNPTILEAFKIRTWFDGLGDSFNFRSLNDSFTSQRQLTWKTINNITDQIDSTEYFTLKASIVMVQKDKCMYRACPAEDCFKKVTCLENGLYQCSKCNREYNNFTWTLILTLDLADFSGSHWVVAFREIAELLVGCTAEQLSKLKEQDEDAFVNFLSDMHFKSYIFKLRSKMEVFNETSRLKTTVLNAKPMHFVSYTKKLLSDIVRFENILNCQ